MTGRAYRSGLDWAHLGGEHELVQGYCDQGYFRRGDICCGNSERRIAHDDGVRADLKKGRNVSVSTLLPLLKPRRRPAMHWHRMRCRHQCSSTGLDSWIAAS